MYTFAYALLIVSSVRGCWPSCANPLLLEAKRSNAYACLIDKCARRAVNISKSLEERSIEKRASRRAFRVFIFAKAQLYAIPVLFWGTSEKISVNLPIVFSNFSK